MALFTAWGELMQVVERRPFKPLSFAQAPLRTMNEILWANAIYVRDFRQRTHWSDRMLRAGAFVLQELVRAYAYLLLLGLDGHFGRRLQVFYLASLLLGEPSLAVASGGEP